MLFVGLGKLYVSYQFILAVFVRARWCVFTQQVVRLRRDTHRQGEKGWVAHNHEGQEMRRAHTCARTVLLKGTMQNVGEPKRHRLDIHVEVRSLRLDCISLALRNKKQVFMLCSSCREAKNIPCVNQDAEAEMHSLTIE